MNIQDISVVVTDTMTLLGMVVAVYFALLSSWAGRRNALTEVHYDVYEDLEAADVRIFLPRKDPPVNSTSDISDFSEVNFRLPGAESACLAAYCSCLERALVFGPINPKPLNPPTTCCTSYLLLYCTCCLLPPTYYSTYYPQHTTYCLLPTAYYLLPTTYYLLPTTCYLVTTTY